MTTTSDVRRARVQLGMALIQADRLSEAASMLRGALEEEGNDPPPWKIHLALGRIAERVDGDVAAALTDVLTAVIEAPPSEAAEPARLALDILPREPGHRWIATLDLAQVEALVRCARPDTAVPEVVNLAAALSMLRGDFDTTKALVSSSAGAEMGAIIGTAQTVVQALGLIEDGSFREALELLDGRASARSGMDATDVASARALALYGLGDLNEALAIAESVPETFSTAVTQALVWLRRAGARIGSDEPSDLIAQASRAASAAARMDPSRPDGLLLRAQVELEGTLDLDAGRRLLEQAVHRLNGDADRASHWRLQRRVRDDDVFRYMTLEVAAACNRTDELAQLQLDELPFAGTKYRQDAHLAQLAAIARQNSGDSEQAGAFFQAAARFYTFAGDTDRALEASQAANTACPTPEGLIQLADDLWQASFRHESKGLDAARATLNAGLKAVETLEDDTLGVSLVQHIEGAYRRGLLLARRADLGEATLPQLWLPLPWLLAAALEDPTHSYRSAHLAWALNAAGLARPALHFAEKALGLLAEDPWLQECYVVMWTNWHGVLSDYAREFIASDSGGDPAWGLAMRELDALNRNEVERVRADVVATAPFNAPWARVIRAQVVMRMDGMERAAPLFRSLLDEATKDPVNSITACDSALMLGDAESARRYIDDGLAEGRVSRRAAEFRRALIDVMTGVGDSAATIRSNVCSAVDPASLRNWAFSLFPNLAAAWPDRDRAAQILGEVQREAEARVTELASLPSLTVEIDDAINTSTDPALDRLVRALLSAEEGGGLTDARTAEDLYHLATETDLHGNAAPTFQAITVSK